MVVYTLQYFKRQKKNTTTSKIKHFNHYTLHKMGTRQKSSFLHSWKIAINNNNNNDNTNANVYDAVIMAEPLREFTQFI